MDYPSPPQVYTEYEFDSSPKKQTNRRRRKGCGCLLAFLVFLLFLAIALAVAAFFLKNHITESWEPYRPDSRQWISFRVPEGSTARSIAEQLEEDNLIAHDYAFMLYCRLNDLGGKLQAGSYQFSPSQSTAEIAAAIAAGEVYTNSVTIPEGFTVAQIGERLIASGLCDKNGWERAHGKIYNRPYLSSFSSDIRDSLEGFLFPDTYRFEEYTTAEDMLNAMLDRFESVWNSVNDATARNDFSIQEIVTIASLIERESRLESEMPRIAGVIYNRLNRGMLLQIDATVLYALGEHKDTVYNEDLKIDSPYNTYAAPGLPPGPIACPGEKALYAALHPEQHEYLYYVATGDGGHAFSTNFNDHLKAQSKYQ